MVNGAQVFESFSRHNMADFVKAHRAQLELLNIPEPLYDDLEKQLESTFVVQENGTAAGCLDVDRLATAPKGNLETLVRSDYGNMLVIPHICSWDILNNPSRGLWEALNELPVSVLQVVYQGLLVLWDELDVAIDDNRASLVDKICDPRTWSRVILYRQGTVVRGALPAPPYFPQVPLDSASDATEADLTGPFPFSYRMQSASTAKTVDSFLAYLSPMAVLDNGRLPTLDLVPSYTCPDPLTRAVRYVALLGKLAPASCIATVKDAHATFVQRMHLVRQEQEQKKEDEAAAAVNTNGSAVAVQESISTTEPDTVLKVYTDANDPMELAHNQAGLTSSSFTMTDSMEDADIIFSYASLFAPGETQELLKRRASSPNPPLINQFPYEGAFVQKDHLGRETLKQHGLPRPRWALETYDLDVQLAEFIGAAVLAKERGEDPVWIAKPARGTQSKGHVVTRSTAQILSLVDARGESRVVQRYIENPVCVDGKKVDCRCVVMMTLATPGKPTLFMHDRVYFRIANKEHSIATPSSLIDAESVLTATHLLDDRTSSNPLQTLPADHKTIAKLEEDYKGIGFDWNGDILPKIHAMIREVFNGMTAAFPAMAESKQARALYGVDVMLEIESGVVEAKLTEVTFCPANNAVCDAYEKDQALFESYNNNVFNCLFRGVVSKDITKLQ